MTHFYFLLFIFFSISAAILAIAFIVYSLRVRHGEGLRVFGLWMFASGGWTISHLLLFAVDNIPQAIWALRLEWFFEVLVPPSCLLFSIHYKDYRRWLFGWRQILLFVFPILLIFLSLSNSATELIWVNLSLNLENTFAPIQYDIGPVLWLFWILAYICFLVAAWIFFRNNHIRGRAYQQQAITLLFVALLTLTMNTFFLIAPQSSVGFNAGPLSFTFCGVIIGLAIYRYRLFDLSPVNYHKLIESLKDGVFVIDKDKRLLQINSQAAELVGINRSTSIGENIQSLFDEKSPWNAIINLDSSQVCEVEIERGQQKYVYMVSCQTIDQSKQVDNRVITIEDVTEQRNSKLSEKIARETAEIRASELDVLRKVAERLNRAVEMNDVTQVGLEEIVIGVGARFGYLILADSEKRPKINGSFRLPPILEGTFDRLSHCPPCKSFDQMMAGNYQEPVSFMPCEILKELSISYPGLISIPLHLGERYLGVLNLVMAPDAVFTGDEIRLLQTVGDQMSAAIERARLYESAELLATVDSLTSLYTRRHFFHLSQHEFDRASRYQYPITILMIDIDYFKHVNDIFGHLIGDQVLQQISQCFRTILRSSDIIGRYGGEEFVVLMPATNLENGRIIAERLRTLVTDHPFKTDKGDVSITISIGVASKEVETDLFLEQVLENADQALLQSKEQGRNKVHIWQNLIE
ncbi:MAG: diguanylate cyclase [Anaerolineaceae bacterium]